MGIRWKGIRLRGKREVMKTLSTLQKCTMTRWHEGHECFVIGMSLFPTRDTANTWLVSCHHLVMMKGVMLCHSVEDVLLLVQNQLNWLCGIEAKVRICCLRDWDSRLGGV